MSFAPEVRAWREEPNEDLGHLACDMLPLHVELTCNKRQPLMGPTLTLGTNSLDPEDNGSL